MIDVSVLVISYNHEKFIEECLESVLRQKTDFSFEILIHDDASSDRTQNIIKRYQLQYPGVIKTVLQKENQFKKGRTHPDEFLFPLIKGKYVCIIEGDDCWCDEYKLQKQFEAMEVQKGCSICVHKTQSIDSEGRKLNQVLGERVFLEGVIPRLDMFKIYFQQNEWVFQTGSYFMRSEIFLDRPCFWSEFYVGDLPMVLWFVHNGDFYFIDEIMSCYGRFSEGSATNLNREKEYAVQKAETNARGLIAFNEYTLKIYWAYLRHITSFYIYQYYSATKEIISDEYFLIAKNELSVKEKVTAKLKYTTVGYKLRNLREDFYKKKIKKD